MSFATKLLGADLLGVRLGGADDLRSKFHAPGGTYNDRRQSVGRMRFHPCKFSPLGRAKMFFSAPEVIALLS